MLVWSRRFSSLTLLIRPSNLRILRNFSDSQVLNRHTTYLVGVSFSRAAGTLPFMVDALLQSQCRPTTRSSVHFFQNSQTQTNKHHTAMKNPSHTFHPTPVLSAILSILRMVPFSFTLVLSKLSFILSTRAEESRISSPMAIVSCLSWLTLEDRMVVFSFSFCDSSDSRTEWEYWPL